MTSLLFALITHYISLSYFVGHQLTTIVRSMMSSVVLAALYLVMVTPYVKSNNDKIVNIVSARGAFYQKCHQLTTAAKRYYRNYSSGNHGRYKYLTPPVTALNASNRQVALNAAV